MDTFIKSYPKFHDILSKKARDNFDFMIDYLCSSPVPNKRPSRKTIKWFTLEECHHYVSYHLYTKENRELVEEILKNRSEILDGDMVNGFSYIYELNKDIILTVESRKYCESVGCLEHELIHLLQAINDNNPKKQYNEFLSFFGEFVTMKKLSELFGNIEIFEYAMLNRLVNRMIYRVYVKDFLDEEIEEKVETDTKEEIVEEIQEELSQNEKEILELERLLEEEKKQQEALEKRIKSKLEELKTVVKENKKVEKKEVKEEKKVNKELNVENTINYSNEIKRIKFDEPIKIKDPDGFRSYTIESYVGIQEQGRNVPSVYFGQSKERVRRYFGGAPKEVREYDEMELYDIFYAYYDEEDKCTGIGIYNQEIYKDKIALYMFGQNLITMKYRDIVKLIIML